MHPVIHRNILFPQLKEYHWILYVISALLILTQFLQLHQASGFFSDDLNFLITYRSYTFSNYITSWANSSVPNYGLISHTLSATGDPFLCHLYILGVLLVGSLTFVYLGSLFGLHGLLTLFMLNIPLSFAFASEPIYFITAFHFTFAWTFALISLVFFFHSCVSPAVWKGSLFFVLSIFSYWMSVTTIPQQAIFPLGTLLIILTPVVHNPRAHWVWGESRRDLFAALKTALSQYQRLLSRCLLFIALTTGAFLVRKFIFGFEYHYYKLGWVDQSLDQLLKGTANFLLLIVHSFDLQPLFALAPPPGAFVLSAVATFVLYVCCFLHYRKTSLAMRTVQSSATLRLRYWVSLVFLFFATVTVLPVSFILFPQARYFMGPSIFLIASLLVLFYTFIEHFFARSTHYHTILTVSFFVLLSCLMLSTYNRYRYIEETYVAKARAYQDFKTILEREIDMRDLPQETQLVILDHDASQLTHGYDHWSTGLLELITGRSDLKGIVTDSRWHSDLFSHVIWDTRRGRGHRKKAVGLLKEKPLKIYKYTTQGFLTPVRYIALKEGLHYNLYELAATPVRIHSAGEMAGIVAYLDEKGIPRSDVWQTKPYPDGYFDRK